MDQRASLLMVSYAFLRSMKQIYKGRWNALDFSINMWRENSWSGQPLQLRKLH